jgi:hypothetical protein
MSKRSEQQCDDGKLFWENVLRLKTVLRLKSPCIIGGHNSENIDRPSPNPTPVAVRLTA